MLERIETRASLRGGGLCQPGVTTRLAVASAEGCLVHFLRIIGPMYTGWSVRSLNAIPMGARFACLALRPLVYAKIDLAHEVPVNKNGWFILFFLGIYL